jgi:hypothetical protein
VLLALQQALVVHMAPLPYMRIFLALAPDSQVLLISTSLGIFLRNIRIECNQSD